MIRYDIAFDRRVAFQGGDGSDMSARRGDERFCSEYPLPITTKVAFSCAADTLPIPPPLALAPFAFLATAALFVVNILARVSILDLFNPSLYVRARLRCICMYVYV